MHQQVPQSTGVSAPQYSDRIGFAQLTQQAFDGVDLRPLRDQLVAQGCGRHGERRRGPRPVADRAAPRATSRRDLRSRRRCSPSISCFARLAPWRSRSLRVLALAAAIDMGGNTPIEFLLEESGIELLTLYVIDGRRVAGAAARS